MAWAESTHAVRAAWETPRGEMDDAAPQPRTRRRFGFRRTEAPLVAPVARRTPTVLVIDDVESIRVLLRTALEPDYTVVGEAGDGQEGARMAEELQPDVVLLDLNMPKHDGLEAIAPIRRGCPGARIVVLTGLPPEVIEDKVLEHGADRFVDKSQPLAELRAVLAEVLG